MSSNHRLSQSVTHTLTPVAILIGALFSPMAHAASFVIGNGVTLTTQQTLNASETGVIQSGGSLNVTAPPAVNAPGDNVSITNSGSISTTTTSGHGYGIWSSGTNASITNSGSISTNGRLLSHGIVAYGANASITNSGSISTISELGNGIVAYGANASITNSGSISTLLSFAGGISSDGPNASITNSGSISTNGWLAHGIGASNASITNSGSISTRGTAANGIFSVGANASIVNSGSISTTGGDASGIRSSGANASITNSGSISTTGANATGIYSLGANANITNSGSIRVTGANSVGIQSIGANGVITVSGIVSATGSATQAILGDNNQTLNLLPGAKIIGTVDLGTGTNRVNVVDSSGPSSTLTVTNAGTVTRSGKGLALVNGSTVSLVDTTGLTADQASLGAASLRISQAVNQQLNAGASAPRPIKVASSQLTPGMLHQEEGPSAWGHVFGGSTQRDASGAALGYKDTGYGLIGGYEQTLSTHRVGFFGGVSHADANTDTASVKTDSDSVFLGVYGQYADGDWLVNASLAAGYVSYDSKRLVFDNLSCDQTARSDYNSTYLSPSFAVIRIFDMGAGFSLRPSVQLNYTYGWFSSYNENGTTRSNLSVGRRNASVLNSRVQVAARQALDNDQGAFEIRLGASQSNYGDDKVKLSLQGGAATSYGITGTNSVSGGYAGIGGRIALKNQLSVVGDIEYTQGSGDNRATLAYLGMEYRF